jgi:hypothetical protein
MNIPPPATFPSRALGAGAQEEQRSAVPGLQDVPEN